MNKDFELIYLSVLTKQGIKPVSRWEKGFSTLTEEKLQAFGLATRVVRRSAQDVAPIRELQQA